MLIKSWRENIRLKRTEEQQHISWKASHWRSLGCIGGAEEIPSQVLLYEACLEAVQGERSWVLSSKPVKKQRLEREGISLSFLLLRHHSKACWKRSCWKASPSWTSAPNWQSLTQMKLVFLSSTRHCLSVLLKIHFSILTRRKHQSKMRVEGQKLEPMNVAKG